jgi:hypothetical protein
MDPEEIGWKGLDWIHLAQDRDQWRTFVNTVMYFRFVTPRTEDAHELKRHFLISQIHYIELKDGQIKNNGMNEACSTYVILFKKRESRRRLKRSRH